MRSMSTMIFIALVAVACSDATAPNTRPPDTAVSEESVFGEMTVYYDEGARREYREHLTAILGRRLPVDRRLTVEERLGRMEKGASELTIQALADAEGETTASIDLGYSRAG